MVGLGRAGGTAARGGDGRPGAGAVRRGARCAVRGPGGAPAEAETLRDDGIDEVAHREGGRVHHEAQRRQADAALGVGRVEGGGVEQPVALAPGERVVVAHHVSALGGLAAQHLLMHVHVHGVQCACA